MASKYSPSLNSAVTTPTISDSVKELNTFLTSDQIDYLKETSLEYGYSMEYDDQSQSLHIYNPDDKHENEHFIFEKDFLTSSRFSLDKNAPQSMYKMGDIFDYYSHMNPNLKEHAKSINFIGPRYTSDGHEILGQFNPKNNKIYITTGNLLQSKYSLQNLEHNLVHESIHSLDWSYRSSDRISSFFSKNKAWATASDGKAPTMYALRVRDDSLSSNWRKRAENLAEVGAYVQSAKRYGAENVMVPSPEGNIPYHVWANSKENKQMVKLADEFISNPERYVETRLGKNEVRPYWYK